MTDTHSDFPRAVLWILLAIFLFDLQGSIIKLLGDRYPVPQIILVRNFFGLFPSLFALLLSREWHRNGRTFRVTRWPLALGRGLMLVTAQLFFYWSLTHLELATATSLAFAGPLFISLLSIPLLGHRVGWWRAVAVVAGFSGVLLVMQPTTEAFTAVLLLPVCAAFFYALSSVSARLFPVEIPTALLNLYASTSTVLLSLLVMLGTSAYGPVGNLVDWGWMALMGACGGFAVLFMIVAYRMAEPGSLSPFEYFGIPFSFILGWLFFDEAPFDRLFPGVLLIVAGGVLVLVRERRRIRKPLGDQPATS